MSQSERYEMLVLRSGVGGKLLAWHMAKSGHRSAVVERRLFGGSCPNTNCLPSKNEIWSAKVADLVHHEDRFGMVTGSVTTESRRLASVRAVHSSSTCRKNDFRIIWDNLAGGDRTARNRLVPYCMFTDPPPARVGLSEAEARHQSIAARAAKLPIAEVLRTRTTSETLGLYEGAGRGRRRPDSGPHDVWS
jgi:pyruvate/2-oxoglutarate dehydrogenase complex dihydrolipoamide dehydrogenase (E3) component